MWNLIFTQKILTKRKYTLLLYSMSTIIFCYAYFVEHEADIAAYRAARATMDRILSGAERPKMDTLKAEYRIMAADKKAPN